MSDQALSELDCRIATATLPTGVHVVAVGGELDLYSADELRGAIWPLAGDPGARVVADLSDVSFIDSTALGILTGASTLLRSNGGEIAVVTSDPRLLRIFEVTGLSRTIRLEPTIAKAVAGLGV